jgi:hypothetical protein
MNAHEFCDVAVARIGALYGSLRFFSEYAESPSPAEVLGGTVAAIEQWNDEKEYEGEVRFDSKTVPTEFSVLQYIGPNAPTLIFHHGSGDVPYHRRLHRIRSAGPDLDRVNLIATNSPYNHTRRQYYWAIRDLRRFVELLAGSVALIEALVRSLSAVDAEPIVQRSVDTQTRRVVVSGISLGGWIANMHHAFYDSADEYRPIFAGAALDATFLDSAYRHLVAPEARRRRGSIRDALNFEDAFRSRQNATVYPLLARFDRYIELHRHAGVYRKERVTAIRKGHVTGATDFARLCTFLGDAFRNLRKNQEV